MKLKILTPKQALNKAFLKQRPLRSEIERFKVNLITLLAKVEAPESEENKKNHVRDFLLNTYYKDKNEVNTKDRKDLVIHLDRTNASNAGVILEAKSLENRAEMMRRDRPNSKAFRELVLYYFDERIDKGNAELKHLIATNAHEWFIFDANAFDKYIYRNTQLKRLYETYKNDGKSNPFIYDEIKTRLEASGEEIPCTYFSLKDYEKALKNDDLEDDKNLIALFKILSAVHLLKEPFADDSNTLNKPFYTELLHLIGLEETKVKGKILIGRKADGKRDEGSLLENAITLLKTKDLLRRVKNIENYGDTTEERYFNIALELCITWINRILFLKLLESQLVSYHKGNADYRFLNFKTIPEFDELFTLFHQVLAIDIKDREGIIREKYRRVPYLNSSLFEISELEDQTITIESLKDTAKLPFVNTTALKALRAAGKTLNTLEYLFRFLDAYDFASEGVEDVQEDTRTLINASVLGKVFEKINGYKDGSIFTPGFITMYMCRQAIRLAVIQKFKDKYGWNISQFSDLSNYLKDRRSTKDVLELNDLINSLHICDPAVGSGHFLVSALNEIIAIKSEIGIFADSDGVRLSDYEITIENDELIITDEKGDFFEYQIHNGKPTAKAHKLQKTLFHEKQTIIENCLFGVDINPNSVKICRLRLWIELLKNAYYKESTGFAYLETLPNIDINIKCANSLLSRFALDEDVSTALKKFKFTIEEYRDKVDRYKNERNRESKRELLEIIDTIKGEFRTEIFKNDKRMIALRNLEGDLFTLQRQSGLFGETDEEQSKRTKKENELKAKIDLEKSEIEEIKSNAIYRNAFEWRFEFPEVLDNEGNFAGFDLVIGNPPYIKEDENRSAFNGLRDQPAYQGKMDIWYLFGDLGINLLKNDALLSFIVTNNWVTNAGASKFRNIAIKTIQFVNLTDFGAYMIFENASIQTMILLFKKDREIDSYTFDYRRLTAKKPIRENALDLLESYDKSSSTWLSPRIDRKSLIDRLFTFNSDENSALLNKIKDRQNFYLREKADKELNLKAEIGSGVDVMQDFVSNANVDKLNGEANVGDGVFILSQTEFDEIAFSDAEKEIIKPYFTTTELQKYFGNPQNRFWLIYTKSDIGKPNKLTKRMPIDDFPKIKEHLDKYRAIITSDFRPYGLHRTREQRLFEGPKIFCLRKCPTEPRFTYSDFDCFISRAFLVIHTDRIDLKYLTGLLNSKLIAFWLRCKGKMQGNAFQIDIEPLLSIPIFEANIEEQAKMIRLVNQILERKKLGIDTSVFEDRLDKLVYRLYELTDEEIATVEC